MDGLHKVKVIIVDEDEWDEVELDDNSLEILWETIDNCLINQ